MDSEGGINADREWGWQYVFLTASLSIDPRSGTKRRDHLDESVIQCSVREAGGQAGLNKQASPPHPAHSFATHFLEDRYGIRTVQELLGHSPLLAVGNKADRVDAHKLAGLLGCGQLNQEVFQMAEPAQSTDQFQLGRVQCSAEAVQDSLATDYRVPSDGVGRFLAEAGDGSEYF